MTTKRTKRPTLIDGLEPVAEQLLQLAIDANFKTPDGAPIAHASAMSASSATSLKRIADKLDELSKQENPLVYELTQTNISLRRIEDSLARLVMVIEGPQIEDRVEDAMKEAMDMEFVNPTPMPHPFYDEDGNPKPVHHGEEWLGRRARPRRNWLVRLYDWLTLPQVR
jgi:hypothetical protein